MKKCRRWSIGLPRTRPTSFRENHHFEYLRDIVFRRLINEADRGLRPKRVRIWCAASSTGEEPYSLAITVSDTFAHLKGWDVRILATDIDTSVLKKAEDGVYSRDLEMEIPPDALQKHFSVRDNELVVRPATKQYLTFRQLNLLHEEWPFRTQFDAIFIRNVLIYFDQKTQNVIMRRIARHLVGDGSLFIGHSESLSNSVTFMSGPAKRSITTPAIALRTSLHRTCQHPAAQAGTQAEDQTNRRRRCRSEYQAARN